MTQARHTISLLMLFIVLLGAFALDLLYGGSGGADVSSGTGLLVLERIRLPKSVSAVLAGSALAVAGLVLQVMFRNPLAGPYVLGISSGASLMVAIVIITGGTAGWISAALIGKTALAAAAIGGSVAVTAIILSVSSRVRSNVMILLIGLMLGQIFGAAQTGLEYFADPAGLKTFIIWGMGSLSNTTNDDLLIFAPVVILALLAGFALIKPLNAMLLGEDYARSAGMNYRRSRLQLILLSSVLCGITTAFCGPVAFIGIAVPVLSRMLFKSSSQLLHYLSCMLLGSIILLMADLACHTVLRDTILPLNMLTTLLGAPVVLILLFRNRQWQ